MSTGVVDDAIEAAEAIERHRHGRLHLAFARDVARQRHRVERPGRAYLLRGRPRLCGIEVGDDDASALGAETPRGGQPDAAGAAGDNRHLLLESHPPCPR